MRNRLLFVFVTLLFLLPFFAFAQSIEDYTVFSNNTLILRDRARIKNGLIGSNTGLQMGYDSALTGDVLSKGTMTMYDRSLVTGNVKVGGSLVLKTQARVTGTKTVNASVPALELPSTAFDNGVLVVDLTVASGTTKEIANVYSNYYRNLVVSSNATLVLKGSWYYIGNLTLQSNATIMLAPDNGGAQIWIKNELKIAGQCRIISGPRLLGTQYDLIFSDQTAALSIGTDGRIEATLTVSRAAVTLGDRTTLLGKLRAKAVTIGYDCVVGGVTSFDADGDGMSDSWETSNGLNPNSNDAANDPDGDSLTNLREFTYGTNPKAADTDGDGLKDGAEYDYWSTHSGGISYYVDSDNDGLINILDPDSDNDGVRDGAELAGWTVTVQGVSKTYVGDAANPDSDGDGVLDGHEKDGSATDWPARVIDQLEIASDDTDSDGVADYTEVEIGLNPKDPQTTGTLSDRKYFEMARHMGEWAVSPTTGHLNPQLAATATSILGANIGLGDDDSTNLSVDRQMELSVLLPQDGLPITLHLDFIYATGVTPDANDKFYDIRYSGAVYPEGGSGAPAIAYSGTSSNSISWRITDPLYYLKGDYFFNFSYHYDKNSGEKPRQIRLYVTYDDNTRVRIEYLSPIKTGTYRTPVHFKLLVTGGAQPAYLRGETALSATSASYIDNVKVTDYDGNLTRSIGRKAFNGYSFQYPLGKLNAYPGGVSGASACNRVEFDWVHDASADKNHVIFAIDEVGYKWADVQLTYDRAYQTQDYPGWYGGLGRNTPVVRRGTPVRVAATNAALQSANAQVTIKNRAGTDVTAQFTVHKESGYEDYAAYDGANATWRENWIVESSANVPVGMYTITARSGAWSASASFYLVFNRSELSIGDVEYTGYAYDEDSDGFALDADTDGGLDLIGTTAFDGPSPQAINPYTKLGVDLAMAVVDGKKSLYEARDAIRQFTGKLIDGINSGVYSKWINYPCYVGLVRSGVTVAEALAGTIDDSHRLCGDCSACAQMSTSLARAAGIPGRIVTGSGAAWHPNYDPDPVTGITTPSNVNAWGNHAWSEAWIENPVPPVTDHWYVFDSLSYMGSTYGISCSRAYYGSVWMVANPSGVHVSSATDPTVMIDVKGFYKP